MVLAAGMSDLGMDLGAIFRLHVIVDTNVIFGDMLAILRKQRLGPQRPAAMELFAKRILVGYFPHEMLGEVHAKCVEISGRYKIALPEVLALWEKYRRHLVIVPTRDLERERTDSKALALRDPTDLPFVQARHIVGASVVLTNDADLGACGVPVMPWSQVLLDLRHYARDEGLRVALFLGSGTAVVVPFIGLVGCVKLIHKMARSIPPKALLIAAAGLGVALLIPQSRKFLLDAGRAIVEKAKRIGSAIGPLITDAVKAGTQAQERAAATRPSLEGRLAKVLGKRLTLTQAVYRACLLAGKPLTPEQVWRAAKSNGAKSRARDPIRAVRRALKSHPLVESLPDGRWRAIALPTEGQL